MMVTLTVGSQKKHSDFEDLNRLRDPGIHTAWSTVFNWDEPERAPHLSFQRDFCLYIYIYIYIYIYTVLHTEI